MRYRDERLVIALAVCVTTIGGAPAGLVLHAKLPDRHLDSDSRDIVKLVIGLLATMSALVLGLLIASAQNTHQTLIANLQQVSANIDELDHLLCFRPCGPRWRPRVT